VEVEEVELKPPLLVATLLEEKPHPAKKERKKK